MKLVKAAYIVALVIAGLMIVGALMGTILAMPLALIPLIAFEKANIISLYY